MALKIEFDTRCPACKRDANVPPDVEGDDVIRCGACGEKLTVKANVGTDVVTAWLVTHASEEAYFAALRAERTP